MTGCSCGKNGSAQSYQDYAGSSTLVLLSEYTGTTPLVDILVSLLSNVVTVVTIYGLFGLFWFCEPPQKCWNNHQHDCGHLRKEEEELTTGVTRVVLLRRVVLLSPIRTELVHWYW